VKVEINITPEQHAFLLDRAKGLTTHRKQVEEKPADVTANDVVRLLIQRYMDEVS